MVCVAVLLAGILLAEVRVVRGKAGRGRAKDILLPVIKLKPSTHFLVPIHHFRIGFGGECVSGNILGEISAVGVLDIPQFDRILEVSRVFVRVQQQLNCLPSHETIRL